VIVSLKTTAAGIGDMICCTPAIRKLSEMYNQSITVYSHKPEIFNNLPYINESILLRKSNFNDTVIDLFNYEFRYIPPQGLSFIPLRHNLSDIRQFPANHLGFYLPPDELTCDYVPEELDNTVTPEEFVVIHAVEGSWSIKNWDKIYWQELCNKIKLPVYQIGKSQDNQGIVVNCLELENTINLVDKLSLDQTWHLCNKAKYVITTDSGILHLAGTTDSEIIYIAMGRKPLFTTPYRYGSQNYKMTVVSNNCDWCMSDYGYAISTNEEAIFECHNIDKECQPLVDQVLKRIQQ
tara:strand:+ start:114 stop:992 length:879 start_codon:yes stop_codon:yes gene_type:complete